jgi:hypothetical protein
VTELVAERTVDAEKVSCRILIGRNGEVVLEFAFGNQHNFSDVFAVGGFYAGIGIVVRVKGRLEVSSR